MTFRTTFTKFTHKTRNLVGLLVLLSLSLTASAQDLGVKTNLLYDASTTPNVAIEFGLARKWTTDIGFGLNPWKFSDQKKIRHWLLQPEVRYWFCQRFDGWFLAAHLMGGEFNAGGVKLPFGIAPKLRDHRYEGWYVGGGIGAGYQWPVSRHFSLGGELAVGYDYLHFRKYPCIECGRKLDEGHQNYFGPTKIAFNVIYLINKGARSRQADVINTQELLPMNEAERTLVLGGSAAVLSPTVTIDSTQAMLSMAVNMDKLQLTREQTVVLRPRLRSADGTQTAEFRPLLINSHRQHVLHTRGVQNKNYPNAIEVERSGDKPLTTAYLDGVPYSAWMDNATLELGEDHCGCGDVIDDATTPLLASIAPEPETTDYLRPLDYVDLTDIVPAPVKPTLNLHGSAFITFVVDRWEVKPNYMNNPTELRKITDTLDVMVQDPNIKVRRIKIHGWASPESPYEHNRMLATNRAQSLTEFVKYMYRLPDDVFAPAEATPENWIGLRQALDTIPESILPHRSAFIAMADKVLADIDKGKINQADRDELSLKRNYPKEYDYILKNVYPHLRRSDYDISFDIRQFTLEEAKEIYKTRPQHLSLRELFDVANTFPMGSAERNQALQQALMQNPDSTVAIINVANIALREGDVLKAETLLQRAGDSAEAWQARAVTLILRKQYDEASEALDKAQQRGADVTRNRQAIRWLKGERE